MAAMAGRLGLPARLRPACRERELALALVISRVVRPASKPSTRTWWSEPRWGADLGIADASTEEIYAAMDWLVDRQDAIERALAGKHLAAAVNPSADGVVRQPGAGGPLRDAPPPVDPVGALDRFISCPATNANNATASAPRPAELLLGQVSPAVDARR